MSVKLKKNKSEEVFSMKRLYGVAVYELENTIEVIRFRSDSELYDFNMSQGVQLEEMGYNLAQLIITTNKVIYLKTLLKARLKELRSYTQKSMKLLQEQMGFIPDEVLAQTQRMIEEHEESLMFSIGCVVSRLLRAGVDVDDELALQCYEYRESARV